MFKDIHYYIDRQYLPDDIKKQISDTTVKFIYKKNNIMEFFKSNSSIIIDRSPTELMEEYAYPDEDEAIDKINEYEDLSRKYQYMADSLRYKANLDNIDLNGEYL